MDFNNLGPIVALEPPTDLERQMMQMHDARMAMRAAEAKKPPTLPGRIDRDEVRARCGRAMQRNLPTDMHCINTSRQWAVIGGGPSINGEVHTIRRLKRAGVNIVTVNKSHDWALEHGIVPWAQILLDPKEWVADYVKRPRKDVRYFVSSQCHDSVFDRLKDYPVFLWHAGQDFEDGNREPDNFLREHYPAAKGYSWRVVPGPTTVGLRAMFLGHNMIPGADVFHMLGMDSSGDGQRMHGYDKPPPPDSRPGDELVLHNGRVFKFPTNTHMSRQFQDFRDLMDKLKGHYEAKRIRKSFRMKFYGSGLLPFYAAKLGLHAEPECNADPTRVGGFKVESNPLPNMEMFNIANDRNRADSQGTTA